MHRTPMRALKTATAVAAAASVLAVAGCATAPGPDAGRASASDFQISGKKEGTLTIITKYGNANYTPYFDSIVEGYEKENPGVDVEMQATGDQAYKDKIKVLAAGRKLPDIFFAWPGAFADQFIDAGYATDLSAVLKGTTWGDSFAPAALKTLEKDGRPYGVPLTLDAKVWTYNKEAFAKAGISVPRTFDELVDSCGKLKAAGYTPIAFGNQDGWPAMQYMTQLNPQRVPADTLAEDYSGDEPEFTDPGYVEALKDFQRLNSKCMTPGANAVSDSTASANFLDGKVGMYYVESLAFGMFSESGGAPKGFEDTWDFFRNPPMPGAAGDQNSLAGAPDGLMVNSQSENKALAVDFLKYMTSRENGTKMLEQLGWLSAVKGTADDAETIPQQHELADMIDNTKTMSVWLDTATSPDVSQAYLASIEGMLGGDLTPEQVMAQVQEASREDDQ